MSNFLLQVTQITIIQIISLFGIFFVFGFILSRIQAAILKNYSSSIGWRGILWTAWLGTPVHEYSHAILAVLFRHKINDVVLFSPDANTGELGHVAHSYNKKSIYQSVGNFFIGSAPLIIGPLLLVILLYVLVPGGRELFSSVPGIQNSFASIANGIKNFFVLLFSFNHLSSWSFWIFLYVSFCIASHLAPSKADLKGVWRGWLLIVLCLFIANCVARLVNSDITKYIISFSHFFSGMIAVYIYTLLISLLHFILSFFILLPWRKK
jgi:hypothetical protein